ncbi:type II toxin-antitoxin system PemK/MazF family toxin [Adhaeribacter arboris]|uniref:mRNA interferase n=1 Tax=Adhaeribacter arboris TaxID=2072846 RepID=A0A2T2YH21_9BACT|nr:type II toxin-antitoxin system PemK/MazF family toxin [Adhaeribacter arboris]PSR54801.1 type II toxin-antitoxin system PemK/MazF family toxin [Adhaeribacter arboris]
MIVKRWGIYRDSLDTVIGSEQGKSRPVLIISDDSTNDLLNIVNVLPLTTRKAGRHIYPNEVLLAKNEYGLPNDSVVLCHQTRTLDKQRLSLEYNRVTNLSKQAEILNALCFQLGIETTTYP